MSGLRVTPESPQTATVVLTVEGELDISNVKELEEEVGRAVEDAARLVILDLRLLQFLDSTGLRAVITADEWVRQRGAKLAIVRGPDQVHRVFQITGLVDRLDFASEPRELLQETEKNSP